MFSPWALGSSGHSALFFPHCAPLETKRLVLAVHEGDYAKHQISWAVGSPPGSSKTTWAGGNRAHISCCQPLYVTCACEDLKLRSGFQELHSASSYPAATLPAPQASLFLWPSTYPRHCLSEPSENSRPLLKPLHQRPGAAGYPQDKLWNPPVSPLCCAIVPLHGLVSLAVPYFCSEDLPCLLGHIILSIISQCCALLPL